MTLQLNGWLDTIGWTLVHFLWQGTVIGVVIAGVLAVCRARASSQARYLVACIGLFALLAAPIATTVMLRSSPSASAVRSAATFAPPAFEPTSQPASRPAGTPIFASTAERASAVVEPWLPLVVSAWLSGVLLLLARFAGASWRVRRLRRVALQSPLSRWHETGLRLADRLLITARIPHR